MFPFDADCAVEFKESDGSTTITAHDAMRVDYAVVSGGCTLSIATGAASSGVVSSSFTFNEVRASCVLSFTAYFGVFTGASSGTLSATSANLASETRTVVASSVVFDAALAAGPLVAGASNTFKRESPYLSRHRRRVIICVWPLVCCSARLQCIPCLILTPRLQSGSRLREGPSSQTTRTYEFPTPSPEAAASIVLTRRQPLVWSMIPSFLWESTKPACCPSPPTSGRALARCQRPAQIWHPRRGRWWQAAWCLAVLLLPARWLRAQRTLSHVRLFVLMQACNHRYHACSMRACVNHAPHVPI
jgi:hypothetical protein